MPKKKIKRKFFLRWLLMIVTIFFIYASALSTGYFFFEKKYKNKIYPGINIGNFYVGGLTPEEAKKILNEQSDLIHKKGIVYTYKNYRAALFPLIASIEGDLAYRIFDFNIEKNITEAFNFGRTNNFYNNLKQKIKAMILYHYFNIYYVLNGNEVTKFLDENYSQYINTAKDAKLKSNAGKSIHTIKFDIEPEKNGQIINYKKNIEDLKNNLLKLNDAPIKLSTNIDYPKIYESDSLNIEAKAKKLLSRAPLSLNYGNDIWWLNFNKIADSLTLKLNKDNLYDEDKIYIGLDYEKIDKFLLDWVAPEINQKPENAKFEIKNGKVVEFQTSEDGLELNILESINKIENELIFGKADKIELVVRELKSELQTEAINDLGIKEIIGIGHSDFSGSPKNRRHNIKIGADALNGVLIKPGDEFSLIKTLGKINKESGYLPELVIKDNRTIPEYGGGLCQIGTTVFRATVNTGLPVTMRRNHSYRVSYYEPAGTDATIYNPWPDYKFKNDTANHILIQARIEGDDIYFDFWGTRDGRTVEKTEPTIYNITRPGPTKLIETLDLAAGVKKCTEHAHNGADAFFDYKITYADSTVVEKRFKSHYVPWREVCLIGIDKLSSEKEKTATSTVKTAE